MDRDAFKRLDNSGPHHSLGDSRHMTVKTSVGYYGRPAHVAGTGTNAQRKRRPVSRQGRTPCPERRSTIPVSVPNTIRHTPLRVCGSSPQSRVVNFRYF